MGGAHAALPGLPEVLPLNPAGLLGADGLQLSGHGGWLFDGDQAQAGLGFLSPAELSLLGLGLRLDRSWTQQTGNYQQSLAASLGVPLSADGRSGLGLTLRHFSSDYGDPGRSLGLDLGGLVRVSLGSKEILAASLSMLDFDSVLKHDSGLEERLPQVIKLGLGLEARQGWRLALDQDFSEAPIGGQRSYALRLGLEKALWGGLLALRLGYAGISDSTTLDPFSGGSRRFSAGFGLKMEGLGLDYSYVPSSGGVGASHLLGASYAWARRARAAAQPLPRRPLAISRALRGDGMALLEWEDPTGQPETAYVILMSYRPDALFSRLAQTGGGQRSLELRGLDNGVTYHFKVVEMNQAGQPVEASLSPSLSVAPEAPAPALAGFLATANEAIASGDFAKARDAAAEARLIDPQRAEIELLLKRLDSMAEGGK